MSDLHQEGSSHYNRELHILACRPQTYNCYSQCDMNGTKFVIWERDRKMKTQNSGVMVEAGGILYYGVLENVVELMYAEGMPVIVFKCKWFNTDPSERGSTKLDHGLLSVDTSTSWYDDRAYCLASTAQQVFYLDDPKAGDSWKVVNLVAPRGIYNVTSLPHDEAYQEATTTNIPNYNFDIGLDEDEEEDSVDYDEDKSDEDEERVDHDEGESDEEEENVEYDEDDGIECD